MADDPNEGVPQTQEVSVINDFIANLVHGKTENETVLVSKVQEDGTMRSWSLQVGRDPNGNERIIATDTDGVLIHKPIVTDEDGNKLPIAGTKDGVLRVNIDGVKKSLEIELLKDILNELRVARLFYQEMSGSVFTVGDLGELEIK